MHNNRTLISQGPLGGNMKKSLLAATTALSFIGATGLHAQTEPTMPVEIVTQDAADTGLNENHLLVPILFLIFIMLTASGASGGGGYLTPQ